MRNNWLIILSIILGVLFTSIAVFANVTITVKGNIIAPPSCVINSGGTATTDFGSFNATEVDGFSHRKEVAYTVSCQSPPSNLMKLRIDGTQADFGFALKTDKPDLALTLFKDSQQIQLGQWVNFTWPTLPKLYAVPAKRPGSTLTGGDFSASATLVVDYQ